MNRAFIVLILALPSLSAQTVVAARAGMIYAIEGAVTIDGQPVVQSSPNKLPQLNPGQILTTPRGHAEILIGQDAVLWTGNNTQVRLEDANVDAPRATLLSGAVILEIKHTRAGRRVSIELGDQTAELSAAGVYRFDRNPDKIRVWSGAFAANRPFDKHDKDELHYFAAYRSLALEEEAGRFEHWNYVANGVYARPQRKVRSREPLKQTIIAGDFKHSGFDLEMSLPISVARGKFLIASEAGLINDANGPVRTGPTTIDSGDGRIEIFLGLGVTARLNQDTRLRIIDTLPTAPIVALEKGEIMIEVAQSAENTRLILHLGDDITELHKPGVYRFDMTSRSPLHAVPLRDSKRADEFFNWNAHRSLELWLSDASFMADWQKLVANDKVRHKQFGDANLGRSVSVKLPPPSIPQISNQPNRTPLPPGR